MPDGLPDFSRRTSFDEQLLHFDFAKWRDSIEPKLSTLVLGGTFDERLARFFRQNRSNVHQMALKLHGSDLGPYAYRLVNLIRGLKAVGVRFIAEPTPTAAASQSTKHTNALECVLQKYRRQRRKG